MNQILKNTLKNALKNIGENASNLSLNLLAMILIERYSGHEGLGVFAYLISIYYAAGFVTEAGIPEYFESRYLSLKHENRETESFWMCLKTSFTVSILFSAGMFFLVYFNIGLSGLNVSKTGYAIICFTIPLVNINKLILAKLYAMEHFSLAARFRFLKKIPFILALLILLVSNSSTSFLMVSFFISELFFLILTLKTLTFSKIHLQKPYFLNTLKHSSEFIFNDKVHDLFLYADFFILGLFVSADKLGVYAETGIFIRFFLLITLAVKPQILAYFTNLAMSDKVHELNSSILKLSGIIFYINSVLCLFFLLHFNSILQFFFMTSGEESVAYQLFVIFIPGLIFFSLAVVFETALSASNQTDDLKYVVILIFILNLCLNFYLVPYAGFHGSATATMISMCAYFMLILKTINLGIFRQIGFTYISAGAFLFIIYKLLEMVSFPVFIEPFIVLIFYYLSGVFDTQSNPEINRHPNIND